MAVSGGLSSLLSWGSLFSIDSFSPSLFGKSMLLLGSKMGTNDSSYDSVFTRTGISLDVSFFLLDGVGKASIGHWVAI